MFETPPLTNRLTVKLCGGSAFNHYYTLTRSRSWHMNIFTSSKYICFSFFRKCHQRAIDSIQASLETEAKGKAEALRFKKKLESDINELEIALDHSNKANSDLQKHIKKLHAEMKLQQAHIEEEQRLASEYREQYAASERRANGLCGELEESRSLLEQSDRGRRHAESELADTQEQLSTLTAHNNSLSLAKRKLESEMQTVHVCCLS